MPRKRSRPSRVPGYHDPSSLQPGGMENPLTPRKPWPGHDRLSSEALGDIPRAQFKGLCEDLRQANVSEDPALLVDDRDVD